MTSLDLFAEPTPRSAETVALWRDHVAQKGRRFAKGFKLAFIAFSVVMLIIFSVAEASSDSGFDLGTTLGVALVFTLYFVLLPVWLLRMFVRRDLRRIALLARDGAAYKAAIVRRVGGPGNIPFVVVRWSEGERPVGGRFEYTRAVEVCDPDEIVVLARKRQQPLVAVFGNGGMQMGFRTRLRKEEKQ